MKNAAYTDENFKLTIEEEEKVNILYKKHQKVVRNYLGQLVIEHYPSLAAEEDKVEFDKMCELSTKMVIVGHACAEIEGREFDSRLFNLSALFGVCCFLGDSFLDDFGNEMTLEYLERLERFLTTGWFKIQNEREQLFYVVVSRIFAESNVFEPRLRQAIFGQFLAQKKDVLWRINSDNLFTLSAQKRIKELKQCAKDRGAYVILVLSLLLAPDLSLEHQHLFYLAGELFMHIDDYGDYHQDIYNRRITFINSVKRPLSVLRRTFDDNMNRIRAGLPENNGRDILLIFLKRYFLTRIRKNKLERNRGDIRWVVYE